MYILDTDVLMAARRADGAPKLAAWLQGRAEETLFLSVVTVAEIEQQIASLSTLDAALAVHLHLWLDRTLLLYADRILPLDGPMARIWGHLSQQTGCGAAALMVAATALSRNATVVTGNPASYAGTGARLENPF